MPMFKYIIWAIIIYVAIRFIFNFIIPVFRASMRMRQQVKEFQDKMNQQNQFQSANNNPEPQKTPSEKSKGDYIEFEEVRK
jgi:hypothetical protein